MIAGIVLGAGRSTRFGSNKMLHPLSDGTPLMVSALRNLRQGVDEVFAVVRPDDVELIRLLGHEQSRIVACPDAERGMGASLACGIRASSHADGWLIALGDMPLVPQAIIVRLADRLRNGGAIVAPVCNGRRGHPVGFSREFIGPLSRLDGDTGARSILEANAARVEFIISEDPGVIHDIDIAADVAPPLR